MKHVSIITLLTALLIYMYTNNATAANEPINATTQVTIVAEPNAAALQFSAQQNLRGKPADALAALQRVVALNKAVSVANLALTARSGINGMTSSGKINLNCTVTVSPDKNVADITIVLSNNDHKMMSSIAVNTGEAIFLGSMQSPKDEAMTEYVFAQVSS